MRLQYLECGINLLGNIGQYYDLANIETKQRIISSIYPEKFQIEDEKLRTTKINELVLLIAKIDGALGKKKAGQNP